MTRKTAQVFACLRCCAPFLLSVLSHGSCVINLRANPAFLELSCGNSANIVGVRNAACFVSHGVAASESLVHEGCHRGGCLTHESLIETRTPSKSHPLPSLLEPMANDGTDSDYAHCDMKQVFVCFLQCSHCVVSSMTTSSVTSVFPCSLCSSAVRESTSVPFS